MSGPRTLDALRSAVARVLTARGEAPGALRVTCEMQPSGVWWATVDGRWPYRLTQMGGTKASACKALWLGIVHLMTVQADASRTAAEHATRALTEAVAWANAEERALTAARAVEAGE